MQNRCKKAKISLTSSRYFIKITSAGMVIFILPEGNGGVLYGRSQSKSQRWAGRRPGWIMRRGGSKSTRRFLHYVLSLLVLLIAPMYLWSAICRLWNRGAFFAPFFGLYKYPLPGVDEIQYPIGGNSPQHLELFSAPGILFV